MITTSEIHLVIHCSGSIKGNENVKIQKQLKSLRRYSLSLFLPCKLIQSNDFSSHCAPHTSHAHSHTRSTRYLYWYLPTCRLMFQLNLELQVEMALCFVIAVDYTFEMNRNVLQEKMIQRMIDGAHRTCRTQRHTKIIQSNQISIYYPKWSAMTTILKHR